MKLEYNTLNVVVCNVVGKCNKMKKYVYRELYVAKR